MSAKRRWKQPDKRMEAAVRMRAAGWSLRKIADHLGVSVGTIHGDLARWERQQVESLITDVQSGRSVGAGLSGELNTGIEQE